MFVCWLRVVFVLSSLVVLLSKCCLSSMLRLWFSFLCVSRSPPVVVFVLRSCCLHVSLIMCVFV